MPVKNEREYRMMATRLETRAAEEGKEKSYKVRGYACTFNDPYVLFSCDGINYCEQIDREAFDSETDTSDVIFQLNHEGMVYARNKNETLTFGTDNHGLWIEADLGLTEESRKIHEAIDKGLLNQMSIAFTVDNEGYDEKKHLRTIYHIKKLYDVSVVSIPANPGTEIYSARSAFEGYIEAEKQELLAAEQRERKKEIIKILLEDF